MGINSGFLVETKKGIKGRTYHKENLVNGKLIVHVDKVNSGGEKITAKLLCDPDTVKITGYVD